MSRIAAALLWIATEEAVSIVVCMLQTLSFAVDGSMPSYEDDWRHNIIYSGHATLIEAYRGVAAFPSSVVSAETPKRSFHTPKASESPKGCSDE